MSGTNGTLAAPCSMTFEAGFVALQLADIVFGGESEEHEGDVGRDVEDAFMPGRRDLSEQPALDALAR
jgi:hypothetical protein